jgi:uncharacterized protein (TIGR03435 family)
MKRTMLAACLMTAGVATGFSAQSPAPRPAALVTIPGAASDALNTTFEVVSVKPSGENTGPLPVAVPMILPQGGRITGRNLPLGLLIRTAYDVNENQVVGAPDWNMSDKFDLQATATFSANPQIMGKELQAAIRALLADRFKLKFHLETRDLPVSVLVLNRSDGRLGPDLKPSTSDCSKGSEEQAKALQSLTSGDQAATLAILKGQPIKCSVTPRMPSAPTPGTAPMIGMHGDGQPMEVIVQLLKQFTGRLIVDKTGLTGLYDFDIQIDLATMLAAASSMGVNVPVPATNLPPSDGPSLLTALQEQLGLKLDSQRGPVEVLVIDAVEKPTPD